MAKGKFKRVVYVGHPSPDGVLMRGTTESFRGHGLAFKKGEVYPVSDHLFDYVSHIRGFAEITDVHNVPLDFPGKEHGLGSDLPEMHTTSGLLV